MIIDPYKVLGVSEQVSDADLKKAYRELSKKWHPDANPDDPEGAEAKFKEIQEAYRQIVDARARGTSAYGRAQQSTSSDTSSNGSGYRRGYAEYNGQFDEFFREWSRYSSERRAGEESNEMTAARNYINAGHYTEALNALGQVAESSRNARWYYYAAIASRGAGNNIDAVRYARTACDMDPGNADYRNLMDQLSNGGPIYSRRWESYGGFGRSADPTAWCLSICALNLLCNCCAGGCYI
ncbi:MAG: J domain-containing protein [Lachnospiraceae bacterium]|nr:J domain-containing protein [Lachnospiraceae bacterium]